MILQQNMRILAFKRMISVTDCVADRPLGPPPPNLNDCGSFSAMRWNHFPQNSLAPLGQGDQWTLPYDVVLQIAIEMPFVFEFANENAERMENYP